MRVLLALSRGWKTAQYRQPGTEGRGYTSFVVGIVSILNGELPMVSKGTLIELR